MAHHHHGPVHRGKLFKWGNPIALLTFSEISLIARLRYALFAFVSMKRNAWPALEDEPAHLWIQRWCGMEGFNRLWKPLFAFKFYEEADKISAAWIWTRVRRIGRSRKSLMQEELGYIEGGSETLVTALTSAIEAAGGVVRTSCAAQHVLSEDGKVTGVQTAAGIFPADAVICTVPTPYVSKLVPQLPAALLARYDAIKNFGVCCLVFRLKRSVTPHFWLNINEPDMEIPGIIEFSNLRPVGGDTVVYVPYYMPTYHPKFSWSDDALLTEAYSYLQRVNPGLIAEDIVGSYVARLRYAQPLCDPGFASKIPPTQTPIAGLQIADTCFYYPEDRGIAESVRLGRAMASKVSK